MAAPVLQPPVVVPSGPVAPGGSFVVTLTATDPDNKSTVFTGTVTDAAGNNAQATFTMTVGDPLTYTLTQPAGAGFTITPRAGSPGVFDCKAP